MYRLIAVLIVLFCSTAFSQTDGEKAEKLAREAIQKMDAGFTAESIELLNQAIELDPENKLYYDYEIAFAYQIDKKYPEAIEILEGLLDDEKVHGQIYQTLGNLYDYNGDPEKAVETYKKGLEIFPDYGGLYLELANITGFTLKDYDKALQLYEMGIKADPMFPSNYYWAAKYYMSSTIKVHGIIYAEIFMNLERNSQRTQEISKMLYDTYYENINCIKTVPLLLSIKPIL